MAGKDGKAGKGAAKERADGEARPRLKRAEYIGRRATMMAEAGVELDREFAKRGVLHAKIVRVLFDNPTAK